jgi:hypothetical protein
MGHCQDSRPFWTSFPLHHAPQTTFRTTCALGLVLMTSVSPATSASLVLGLLSIGSMVITLPLPYLPSPNPFLSYLTLLSYRPFLLFTVWTMVAPATPSHSILVSLSMPNTGKHGPSTGLCANHLGIYSRVLAHVFARLNLTDSPAFYPSTLVLLSSVANPRAPQGQVGCKWC